MADIPIDPLEKLPAKRNTTASPSSAGAIFFAFWGCVTAAFAIFQFGIRGLNASASALSVVSIPIFHLVAEFCMATLPAVGAIAWIRGRNSNWWGPAVMLFGFGTWFYAVANASAWAVVNERWILIPLAITIIIALVFGPSLVTKPKSTVFSEKTRFRKAATVVCLLFALQVYSVWTMFFVQGAMSDVLSPHTDAGMYIIRDLTGELPMVAAIILSAWACRRRLVWGPGLALFACGMLFYSGVNNLSPSVVSSVTMSIYQIVTIAVALWGLAWAALRYRSELSN